MYSNWFNLLCVQENKNNKPTITKIVSYLDGHALELPSPLKPAFFLLERIDQNIATQHFFC